MYPAGSSPSVALSADGSTALVVGGTSTSQTAAWVFKRGSPDWTQVGPALSVSGFSTALSASGATAVIGAPFSGNHGAAAVFVTAVPRDFNAGAIRRASLRSHLGPILHRLKQCRRDLQIRAQPFHVRLRHLADGTFGQRCKIRPHPDNSKTGLAYLGFGNGDGTFTFRPLSWGPGYDVVEIGDLDGDGKDDVVLYNSSTGTMYTGIGDGSGGFNYKYTLISPGYNLVRVAGFTGDGKAGLFLYNSATAQANLGISDGNGGFTFHPLTLFPGFTLVDIGDLNGDGKADILLYNPSNGFVETGVSDGVGGLNLGTTGFDSGFTSVRLGRFKTDSAADVLLYNANTGAAVLASDYGSNICFRPFQGYTQCPPFFRQVTPLFWGPGYDGVEIEDVNGDGQSDVILYNSSTGTEYTGINDGHGVFTFTYSDWGSRKILAR